MASTCTHHINQFLYNIMLPQRAPCTLMSPISMSLIQDWIYRQLLTLSEPLHPTLPPLLQEFVSSILLSAITPGPRGAGGYNTAANKCHAPFTDEEVRFSLQPYSYGSTYQISATISSNIIRVNLRICELQSFWPKYLATK